MLQLRPWLPWMVPSCSARRSASPGPSPSRPAALKGKRPTGQACDAAAPLLPHGVGGQCACARSCVCVASAAPPQPPPRLRFSSCARDLHQTSVKLHARSLLPAAKRCGHLTDHIMIEAGAVTHIALQRARLGQLPAVDSQLAVASNRRPSADHGLLTLNYGPSTQPKSTSNHSHQCHGVRPAMTAP